MSNELVTNGIALMLFGMGVVFSFLSMLVIAIAIMSQTIRRFFSEPVVVPATETPESEILSTQLPSKRVLAVIQAAINVHRQGS